MVKILWIDDEIELLKPHILTLQSKGYEVDTCNNGYDAVEMAAERAYDVIILDEMMPGMTGLETLPLIKDICPTTPVIMVTKSEEEDIMDKAIGSKIADYIVKPVNPSQIDAFRAFIHHQAADMCALVHSSESFVKGVLPHTWVNIIVQSDYTELRRVE